MAFDGGRSQSSRSAGERSVSSAHQRGETESEQTPASSRASAARHYGLELDTERELRRLQRLEKKVSVQRIRQWASEGMPIEAMETPRTVEAFRQRKGTPVPWDVEQRNEESVQRSSQAASDTSPAGDAGVPDTVREVISSQGRSLDPSIQRAMEDRMGDNFGDVRVHTGPKAAQACESIDARAFTVGNHVAFNSGEYNPSSAEGQHVLAHELAHVRQQTQGAVSMLPQEDTELEIDPDPALEREAEETAQRAMTGGPVTVNRMGAEMHVQRWAGSMHSSQYTDAGSDGSGRVDPRAAKTVSENHHLQYDDDGALDLGGLQRSRDEVESLEGAIEALEGQVDPTTVRMAWWFAEGMAGSMAVAEIVDVLIDGLEIGPSAATLITSAVAGGTNAGRKELNHRGVYILREITSRLGAEAALAKVYELMGRKAPWKDDTEYK